MQISDPSLEVSTSPAQARLAIVIVTHNRVESLIRTLRRLTALPETFPIVIVDNASTDETVPRVRRQFPQVAMVQLTKNIGAVARNYGVRHARCEYIAFADDDSWWAPGSLSRAIALFDRHLRLALIMSRVLIGPEERTDPTCELMARSPLPKNDTAPGVPILGFIACGAVVRRDAFLAVGGFDEHFGTGGEEAWVAMNLADQGWDLAYVDSVVSHHYPAKTREMRSRRIEGHSDRLWEAWLRRPLKAVARVTGAYLWLALWRSEERQGLFRALRQLPRIMRQRRVLSPAVEAGVVLLERQNRRTMIGSWVASLKVAGRKV